MDIEMIGGPFDGCSCSARSGKLPLSLSLPVASKPVVTFACDDGPPVQNGWRCVEYCLVYHESGRPFLMLHDLAIAKGLA